MKKIAIFPGSFDPFTKGHEDVVLRGLNIFDEIIVAIGHNTSKKRYFQVEMVQQKIADTFANHQPIKVVVYNELTVSLAEKHGARFLLRGLRNTTDFEYENTIAQANRHINEKLETVFLITSPQYAAINSSIIRELHKYGADVSDFLPYNIE